MFESLLSGRFNLSQVRSVEAAAHADLLELLNNNFRDFLRLVEAVRKGEAIADHFVGPVQSRFVVLQIREEHPGGLHCLKPTPVAVALVKKYVTGDGINMKIEDLEAQEQEDDKK